ncbi:MAG: hypothetical protein NZ480_07215 [Bdellovibrionaceae bacterium]|nr:hypothetical protein [Pseudobdellovibrionaceae bacterium]
MVFWISCFFKKTEFLHHADTGARAMAMEHCPGNLRTGVRTPVLRQHPAAYSPGIEMKISGIMDRKNENVLALCADPSDVTSPREIILKLQSLSWPSKIQVP